MGTRHRKRDDLECVRAAGQIVRRADAHEIAPTEVCAIARKAEAAQNQHEVVAAAGAVPARMTVRYHDREDRENEKRPSIRGVVEKIEEARMGKRPPRTGLQSHLG